jgi:uncharacterized membrane protein
MKIWLIVLTVLVVLLILRAILRAVQDAHHAAELEKLCERAKQMKKDRGIL